MSSRNAALFLTLAAAVELCGLWYLAADPSGGGEVSAAPPASMASSEVGSDVARLRVPRAGDVGSLAESTDEMRERELVPKSALRGRVLGANGRPLAAAALSWTTLSDEMFDAASASESLRAGAIDAHTVSSSTDADGSFEFPAAPPRSDATPSVLWITHEDHQAHSIVLGGDREAWPSLAAVALRSGTGLEVRVDDIDGAVAGAHVEQMGVLPESAAHGARLPVELAARRALRRSVTTGRTGWTRLVPVSGTVILRARHEDRVSAPRLVANATDGNARVTLTLSSTFLASGRVLGLDSIVEPGFAPRVTCHAQRGNVKRALETLAVGADGRFGPVALPILEDADVRFVLHGAPLISKAFLARAPKAGSRVEIELTAEIGSDVWFKIVDPEEQSLPQAEAIVHWIADGVALELRARPRPDGFTVVRGAPPGTVVCEARAQGFGSTKLEAETLPEIEPSTRGVMLFPSGRLSGRCTHDGKPVRDFEITVWPANNSYNSIRHTFSDRDDGTFSIDDAPLGMVCALAASSGFAPAEVARVEVRAEISPEIAFELAAPVRGRGKVVARESGAPLADARVELHSSDGYDVIASLGPAEPVAADGTFEIDGFAAGRMICAVSAPGYATSRVAAQGSGSEPIDLGVIALVKKRALEIRLDLADGVDATAYDVSLTGAEIVPPTPFSAHGLVRIDAISPGSYEMHVMRGGELAFGSYPMLEFDGDSAAGSSAPWRIDVPMASSHAVAIELVGNDERLRTGELGIVVSFRGPAGEQMERYVAVDTAGRAVCEGVLAGEISVSVFDTKEDVLTTVHARMDADERELRVIVPIASSAEIFPVRVVDARGEGVAGVRVQLARAGAGAAWSEETSAADGMCRFRGIEAGAYLAHLFHQSRGRRVGVPLELIANAEAPVLIELAADARVEARFTDGNVPQAGVRATLYDAEKTIAFAVMRSNESGIARADGLAEAEYVIEVDEPEYFPALVRVRSAIDGDATPIEIKRRGDLEIEIRGTTGKRRARVHVQLTSIETETDVAAWCAEGLVEMPAQGLTTDSQGMLAIKGLPHGAYRWRASDSSGAVTGVVVVPPASVERVMITLP